MKQRLTNWNAKDTEKSRQKALELCENARGQLVLHYPFVGHLGLQIEFIPVVDSRIRTIATNGKVIYIRPEWIIQLPVVTRAAIIAHTIWTAALCHSFRRGELEARRFDLASDLEVYSLLNAEKVSMAIKPDYADRFPKHQTVEEIFKALPEDVVERSEDADVHLYLAGRVVLPTLAEQALEAERKKQQEQMPVEKHSSSKQSQESEQSGEQEDGQRENAEAQQGNGGVDGGETQSDQDASGNREGDSRVGEESTGGAEENPSGDDGEYPETAPGGKCPQNTQAKNRKPGKENQGETQSTLKDAEDAVHDAAVDTECDPMMREVWRQRILETAQAYEMMHGTLPADIAEVVQQFRESKIDYMQKLRRYLTLHSGGETKWLPPAKRFVWQKMYLPSHNNGRLEAVLAIDTSGSTQDYLDQFYGDTLKIMRQFGRFQLTVIQCDAEITEVKEYTENSRTPKEITVKGGGGTSFLPVFNYIREKALKPRVMLYFTDGFGEAPEKAPDYPVIWVLTPHGEKPCAWGDVIQIPEDEFPYEDR
jgi:predicted metal-dependent peptidase